VARLGRPNVRIQFDFYHVQIVGGDLIRRFETHFPAIGHVQIAGVPSRHEPDEGEVNYPAIFALLDRSGYAGWVGCEYRPRGRTEDGLGWARPYGVVPRDGAIAGTP
jgi:hydroxypyruvate isomerase